MVSGIGTRRITRSGVVINGERVKDKRIIVVHLTSLSPTPRNFVLIGTT